MSLTVDEINQIQFNTKMRGYNPTEVNDFIKEVAQTVQELTDQNRALQEKVKADERTAVALLLLCGSRRRHIWPGRPGML